MLGGTNNYLFFMSLAGFPVVLFARQVIPGGEGDYGSLVAVASPSNHIEGEMLRQRLLAVKIRATLTQTNDGPRIFVFPEEESAARAHLKSFS
jgi:hypothetical protein